MPDAPTPKPQQEASPPESNAERLLRAQAVELQSLRSRVQDLPDPDALAEWRAKAERFDALAADLPTLRQQVADQFAAERQQLQQQAQVQEQRAQAADLRAEAQRVFLQGGGNPALWDSHWELYGKHIKRDEQGQLVTLASGQAVPLQDVQQQLRTDPLHGHFFYPTMGSGSGARSSRDGRVVNRPDLLKMPKDQLWSQAFSRSGADA